MATLTVLEPHVQEFAIEKRTVLFVLFLNLYLTTVLSCMFLKFGIGLK